MLKYFFMETRQNNGPERPGHKIENGRKSVLNQLQFEK